MNDIMRLYARAGGLWAAARAIAEMGVFDPEADIGRQRARRRLERKARKLEKMADALADQDREDYAEFVSDRRDLQLSGTM